MGMMKVTKILLRNPDCYKDDKDREYLEGLSQMEREEILAKRFENRENLKR